MERYDLNAVPNASSEAAGVLRVANEVDEKNCGCNDAAITPSNLHNLLGSRKANTKYKGNEIVACPYQPGLLLKCVQAGTTSTNPLDTTKVTVGQVITDGDVKWEVIVLPVELGGHGGRTVEEARANLATNLKTYTTFEQLGFTDIPSLTALLEALPNYSKFVRFIGSNDVAAVGVPDAGVLEITKGQYFDYASLHFNRYGGDSIERKMWYENWAKGQTELKWKQLSHATVEKIPANSDLNNYTSVGKYSCWLTTNAKSLSNNPMSALTTGIILEVIEDGNNILQIVYGTLVKGMYIRRYSNASWNGWQDISKDDIHITEVYKSGLSWYVKYSNGWVEQGSSVSLSAGADKWNMITLLIPMADKSYSVIASARNGATGQTYELGVGNSEVNTDTQVGIMAEFANTGAVYRVAGWAAE